MTPALPEVNFGPPTEGLHGAPSQPRPGRLPALNKNSRRSGASSKISSSVRFRRISLQSTPAGSDPSNRCREPAVIPNGMDHGANEPVAAMKPDGPQVERWHDHQESGFRASSQSME